MTQFKQHSTRLDMNISLLINRRPCLCGFEESFVKSDQKQTTNDVIIRVISDILNL